MKADGSPHPGISMHHLPVGAGVAGFIFVAGTVLVFLLGIPSLRWFLAGSIAVGLAVAVALYLIHKYLPSHPLRDEILPPMKQ